jgi:hypothetical protein
VNKLLGPVSPAIEQGKVTGPISSLPGSIHMLPAGATCDHHPDRPAVTRVQGETDSFGCEMLDLCTQCIEEVRRYARSAESRTGTCDWCRKPATDLRAARDYDEGMAGPVYRVCSACIRKRNEEARRELDEMDRGSDDWED